MSQWTYAVTPERAAALAVHADFASVAAGVAREMQVLCRHRQLCDDAAGFARVVYCFSLTPNLFDFFFNSEYGYRGAYFRSPYEGLAANDAILRRLLPKLLVHADSLGISDPEFDKASLSTPSAKVWLSEAGVKLCEKCDGEWSPPQDECAEILNKRWELDSSRNAVCGRKAPFLTKVKVFGAFLNERYDEFVSWRKRHRAREISLYGWS